VKAASSALGRDGDGDGDGDASGTKTIENNTVENN